MDDYSLEKPVAFEEFIFFSFRLSFRILTFRQLINACFIPKHCQIKKRKRKKKKKDKEGKAVLCYKWLLCHLFGKCILVHVCSIHPARAFLFRCCIRWLVVLVIIGVIVCDVHVTHIILLVLGSRGNRSVDQSLMIVTLYFVCVIVKSVYFASVMQNYNFNCRHWQTGKRIEKKSVFFSTS